MHTERLLARLQEIHESMYVSTQSSTINTYTADGLGAWKCPMYKRKKAATSRPVCFVLDPA